MSSAGEVNEPDNKGVLGHSRYICPLDVGFTSQVQYTSTALTHVFPES